MKAYLTRLIPNVTIAQVASQAQVKAQFENYLTQASSMGWDLEQVTDAPNGLWFVLSSTVAAAQPQNQPQLTWGV